MGSMLKALTLFRLRRRFQWDGLTEQ